ncbi:formylglycine-generating enzyme family protein [Treponema denticola]|uniref:formylglycine-generating enzyme family protein n=1 Tax=Treponema denticola TaxID=158 RepID=UPI0020A31BA5|nr:SUMF1/EgtB/PvdO family nonheme iron enzyme [Treponema denticola]
MLFTACPNNAGGGGDSTVNITVKKVQGEGKVGTIPSDPVSVPLGSSWSSVKEILRSKIVFTPGFTLNSGHPGDDANTQEFADGYIFYEDATVFIKSRKDLPDISTIQGPGTQIKITLAVDPERGQILGPEVISVNSGTTWAQLEAYAKAALKANYGFKEEGAEWKNGSTVLGSTDSFGTDATLTAYPEDIRIRIKVTGDNNKVTIDKPDEPIIAIPGTKWKEIKAKADDKVRVKDKTRYAVTAWHKGSNASDPTLTDSSTFQEVDRPNCTVFAETGDRSIELTVKYGTGSGTPLSGGTITIYDGDTWGSVKVQAEGKISLGFSIREWRLNGKSGQVINDSYTFKASGGNAQTVYALTKPDIYRYNSMGDGVLNYFAPINGTITECSYKLKFISKVTKGTVGVANQPETHPKNPLREINLTAYQIGETEIPQALYELVMGNNPSAFQGSSRPPAAGEKQALRPVEQVTWHDAVAFCNELTRCTQGLGEKQCVYTYNGHTYTVQDARGKKIPQMNMSKKGFRLPTEAEWEWAAQGGPARHAYAGTDNLSELENYAWRDNKTHEVKKKTENFFKLYDMSGNVYHGVYFTLI